MMKKSLLTTTLAISLTAIGKPAHSQDIEIIRVEQTNTGIRLTLTKDTILSSREVKFLIPKYFNYFCYDLKTTSTSKEIASLKLLEGFISSIGTLRSNGIPDSIKGLTDPDRTAMINEYNEFLNQFEEWENSVIDIKKKIIEFKGSHSWNTFIFQEKDFNKISSDIDAFDVLKNSMEEKYKAIKKPKIDIVNYSEARKLIKEVELGQNEILKFLSFVKSRRTKSASISYTDVEKSKPGHLVTAILKIIPNDFVPDLEGNESSIDYFTTSINNSFVHIGPIFQNKSRITIEPSLFKGDTVYKSIQNDSSSADLGIFFTKPFFNFKSLDIENKAGWCIGTLYNSSLKSLPLLAGITLPMTFIEGSKVLLNAGFQWKDTEEGVNLLKDQTNLYESFKRKKEQSLFFAITYTLR